MAAGVCLWSWPGDTDAVAVAAGSPVLRLAPRCELPAWWPVVVTGAAWGLLIGVQIVCGVTQLFGFGAALSEYAGPGGGGTPEFVYARSGSLLRTALLLTGQNRAEAEDLLQLALERAYRHWASVCRSGEPERYVRGILANASADRWRRLARRAERPLPATGAGPALPDPAAAVADRDYLLRAL